MPQKVCRRHHRAVHEEGFRGERLYEVGRVVDAVGRAYRGDRDAIEAFLNRPHPLLDGETPFDRARSSSAGAEAVLNLVRRAEAGIAP